VIGLVLGWYTGTVGLVEGTGLVKGWYKVGTGLVQGWYRVHGWYLLILARGCKLFKCAAPLILYNITKYYCQKTFIFNTG
jgi:hypothetical protein